MNQATLNPISAAQIRMGIPALEARGLYWLTATVLFVTMVANQTHIETDEAIKLAPRLEILARLGGTALAGLIGLYGMLFFRQCRNAVLRLPAAWLLGVTLCFLFSTVASDFRSVAVPHLVTFACIVLFAPVALFVLGSRRFVEVALLALLTSLIASWLLYFLMPEFGVKLEIVDSSGDQMVPRMSGTSHPNTLAGISGFVLLITTFLWSERRMSWRLAVPILGLCGATFLMTQTRVAAVAPIISILIVYRDFWFKRNVFPYTLIVAAGVLVLTATMLILSPVQWMAGSAESITRSGDIEEITSVTGRNEVWSFVADKIREAPVLGYGPGVAKVLLEREGLLLHPHNVVLYCALSGGIMCGIFAAGLFLQQLWISIRGHWRLAALITFYVFLNSLTETFVFDYIPGTNTILFLAALFWPALDDRSL